MSKKRDLGRKILIIDDESSIRHLFTRILKREGYQISTVSDGEAALGSFQKNNFDLVVLDLRMPKMSGFEVFHRLREKRKELPVIVITGYPGTEQDKEKMEALTEKATAFFTKPFDLEEIKKAIKKALNL